MRKFVLLISALLFSLNVFAAGNPHNLSTSIMNALQQKANINANKTTAVAAYPIIYGGQDISRKIVASAHESVWSGQSTFIG